MRTGVIGYGHGDRELSGFLALEEGGGKRPGVLVVHGGAGLDEHAKGRAMQVASLGYVAFACDLYGGGVGGDRQRIMARATELSGDPVQLCGLAQAGLDVLRSQAEVDAARVAAAGYCFGGMTVLQMARIGAEVAGVASIHGSLKTTIPASAGRIKAKVLVCHGALDPHVPMTDVNAFMEEMNGAGADWQLIVYGGAMHGFTHENAVDGKIPGVAYQRAADLRSRAALRTFLEEVFAV